MLAITIRGEIKPFAPVGHQVEGIKPETVEKTISDELEWFKTNFVTAEELNRAKTLITAEYAYHGDGSAD